MKLLQFLNMLSYKIYTSVTIGLPIKMKHLINRFSNNHKIIPCSKNVYWSRTQSLFSYFARARAFGSQPNYMF